MATVKKASGTRKIYCKQPVTNPSRAGLRRYRETCEAVSWEKVDAVCNRILR